MTANGDGVDGMNRGDGGVEACLLFSPARSAQGAWPHCVVWPLQETNRIVTGCEVVVLTVS